MLASNDAHKSWPQRKLLELLGNLAGKTVAVWGLSYKPGTDSIRRSAAIELCRKVGGTVKAAAFIIELSFLNGRKRLDVPTTALVSYDT